MVLRRPAFTAQAAGRPVARSGQAESSAWELVCRVANCQEDEAMRMENVVERPA
jgi:hypothetical protein